MLTAFDKSWRKSSMSSSNGSLQHWGSIICLLNLYTDLSHVFLNKRNIKIAFAEPGETEHGPGTSIFWNVWDHHQCSRHSAMRGEKWNTAKLIIRILFSFSKIEVNTNYCPHSTHLDRMSCSLQSFSPPSPKIRMHESPYSNTAEIRWAKEP